VEKLGTAPAKMPFPGPPRPSAARAVLGAAASFGRVRGAEIQPVAAERGERNAPGLREALPSVSARHAAATSSSQTNDPRVARRTSTTPWPSTHFVELVRQNRRAPHHPTELYVPDSPGRAVRRGTEDGFFHELNRNVQRGAPPRQPCRLRRPSCVVSGSPALPSQDRNGWTRKF